MFLQQSAYMRLEKCRLEKVSAYEGCRRLCLTTVIGLLLEGVKKLKTDLRLFKTCSVCSDWEHLEGFIKHNICVTKSSFVNLKIL